MDRKRSANYLTRISGFLVRRLAPANVKARLRSRKDRVVAALHRLRNTPPLKLLEMVVWWVAG